MDLRTLLPEKTGMWEPAGDIRWFDHKTLYDYIDGGAELFISYDFINMVNQNYSTPGQPGITVDIFDMGSSENAYGIFCHVREEEKVVYGQGSVVYEDAILFWKDRYYVSIMADNITDDSKTAIRTMAKYIEKSVPNTGSLPSIVKSLPEKGLHRESIVYFKHYIWQNSLYFIANDNILSIQDDDAVLARYTIGDQHLVLLLIRFKNRESSQKAYGNFTGEFKMQLSNPSFIKKEDVTWVGCYKKGEVFSAVFKSINRETEKELLDQIK